MEGSFWGDGNWIILAIYRQITGWGWDRLTYPEYTNGDVTIETNELDTGNGSQGGESFQNVGYYKAGFTASIKISVRNNLQPSPNVLCNYIWYYKTNQQLVSFAFYYVVSFPNLWAPEICGSYFKHIVFKLIIQNNNLVIQRGIALRLTLHIPPNKK